VRTTVTEAEKQLLEQARGIVGELNQLRAGRGEPVMFTVRAARNGVLCEGYGWLVTGGHRNWVRYFALQQQARDLGGRHIATGGGYSGTPYTSFVAATSPEGSRRASQDSWRCHHGHPDDLTALECALGEVRRLADGGSYEPCSTGPDCEDEFCRRDWAALGTPSSSLRSSADPA
jgi:hypothetical protein